MHIEGKDLPQGKYLFQRYVMDNGSKVKVNTYKIERTTEGYEFYDSETKIEDELTQPTQVGRACCFTTQDPRRSLIQLERFPQSS